MSHSDPHQTEANPAAADDEQFSLEPTEPRRRLAVAIFAGATLGMVALIVFLKFMFSGVTADNDPANDSQPRSVVNDGFESEPAPGGTDVALPRGGQQPPAEQPVEKQHDEPVDEPAD